MDLENKLIIFCDGGSRGNPGPAAYGFVIKDAKGNLVHQTGKKIGITTNNVAEYSAVLEALRYVLKHAEIAGTIGGISFFLDSLLVVSQLNGIYKIKQSHLRDLIFQIRIKEQELHIPISYTHVRREKNKEADAMVNAALDNII